MIMSVTGGCRSRIIEMESVQLAQNAGTLVRTALLNPTPPVLSGSVAASFVNASHKSGAMPKMAHMHLHNPASWAPTPWPTLAKQHAGSNWPWHSRNVTAVPTHFERQGPTGCAATTRCGLGSCGQDGVVRTVRDPTVCPKS